MKRIENENIYGCNEHYPEVPTQCCDEMVLLMKTIPPFKYTSLGEGECSGSIEWDNENKVLELDNGWNDTVFIQFRFCPFCGKEQK